MFWCCTKKGFSEKIIVRAKETNLKIKISITDFPPNIFFIYS